MAEVYVRHRREVAGVQPRAAGQQPGIDELRGRQLERPDHRDARVGKRDTGDAAGQQRVLRAFPSARRAGEGNPARSEDQREDSAKAENEEAQ